MAARPHPFPSGILLRGVAQDFEGVRTAGKLSAEGAPKLVGSGSMLPQKIWKLRVSETPFPTISAERFYKKMRPKN